MSASGHWKIESASGSSPDPLPVQIPVSPALTSVCHRGQMDKKEKTGGNIWFKNATHSVSLLLPIFVGYVLI